MADKTITQLNEFTDVQPTDLLYGVDDPSGTPVSKKCTVSSALLSQNSLSEVLPIYTDILGFVDDPSGTPAMSKATLQAIVKAAASQGALTNIVDANLTVSRALASDGSGKITVSDTTATELGYVNGVTSAIQTQIDGKEDTITNLPISQGGTNSTTALNNDRIMVSSGDAIVEGSAITASRALASNASGIPIASATTSTELGYVNGVTSGIQAQIDSKISLAGYTTSNAAGSADKYTKIADIDLTAQYQACGFTLNVIGYNEGTTDQFEFAQVSMRVNQAAAMESEPDVNVKVCNNNILDGSNFHAVIVTNSASHTIVELYLKYTKDYQGYTVVPLTSAGTGTNTFYSSQSIDASLPAGTSEPGEMVSSGSYSTFAQQMLIAQLKTIVSDPANIERLIFFDATGTATELTDRAGVDNADLGQTANECLPGVSGCARTLRFDGSSTYFEFPDADDLSPSGASGHTFSVVACVKPKAVDIDQQILAKADYTTSSEAREWEFYLDSSNHLTTKFFDESTDGYKTIASTNNISYDLNNWNCYSFAYNGYVDFVTFRNGEYWNDAGYTTSGTFTAPENLTAKCGNYRTSTAGAKEQISNMQYGVVLIINEQLDQATMKEISNLFLTYVGTDVAAI